MKKERRRRCRIIARNTRNSNIQQIWSVRHQGEDCSGCAKFTGESIPQNYFNKFINALQKMFKFRSIAWAKKKLSRPKIKVSGIFSSLICGKEIPELMINADISLVQRSRNRQTLHLSTNTAILIVSHNNQLNPKVNYQPALCQSLFDRSFV